MGEKICPLSFGDSSDREYVRCKGDDCGWWAGNVCAVKSISWSLNTKAQEKKIRALKKNREK